MIMKKLIVAIIVLTSINSFSQKIIKFDDTRSLEWEKEFEIVEITSSKDQNTQLAYFYKSKSKKPQPLIVSLHTWSGGYTQKDSISQLSKQMDINYIHPDFRGPNRTKQACCSELAMNDIDDAISYAIKNANVDKDKIFIIGVSGGGYATLSAFMKSRHKINTFSAWASISDLTAWHNQCSIRGTKYAQDVLDCTNSHENLNIENAQNKSPIYWPTPKKKTKKSKLKIYAGIYDGIKGSVPITHSINFYNKLLADLSVKDSTKYVSTNEKLHLLEYRKPIGNYGTISGRRICLKKEYQNIQLIIFEGDHEMLTEFAFNSLLNQE